MVLSFVYDKLRNRIREKYGKQAALAYEIGMSEHTISEKLTGKKFFTQGEIIRICKKLDIPAMEIGEYFFTPKVQTN